jgi:hypothetical protein
MVGMIARDCLKTLSLTFLLGVALTGAAGCGSEEKSCDPVAGSGCENGQVCEVVQGGEPACFAPLLIRGQVFDLADGEAVADANVVALDVNGAAASGVAVSDETGAYELSVPATRNADGVPIGVELTLRADASGYQTFPSGLRQALPVDTEEAVEDENGDFVLASTLTEIALLGLPAGSGDAQIFGSIEVPDSSVGALVVATGSDGRGYTAVADRSGEYRIFNLPAGDYEVLAYSRGLNYAAADATVAAGGEVEVDLSVADKNTGTVMGTVQIVNAPGGAVTSVILAIESTLDENLGRGQTVPGLRAPTPGTAPNITGDYSFEGVPAGRYVVLAAFENDALVRDPDLSIGGTSILHIEVQPGMTTTVAGFKVTEALEVFGPGAGEAEAVTGAPTFSWADDSSEASYDVEVYDAFGNLVWESTIDGVSGGDPSLVYGGPELKPGMYYQFRVTSLANDGVPRARTEDLEGVFFVPVAAPAAN